MSASVDQGIVTFSSPKAKVAAFYGRVGRILAQRFSLIVDLRGS